MLKVLSAMFCSFFTQTEKETALNPLVASLKLPAELPKFYTYEERQKAVAHLIRIRMRSQRISVRIVNIICDYYGVNLCGTGTFARDPRNSAMLLIRQN